MFALIFLILGAVVYENTFRLQRSSQAIYVVLHNEIDYAIAYRKEKINGSGDNQDLVASSRIHVHDFSIDVGSGEVYHGRSFLYDASAIVIVDSPAPSGWLIASSVGQEPGECKKLFGTDGTEEALNARWKNVCQFASKGINKVGQD
ncbi:hypothetical protein [Stenotrophobium rhamnosiphilum]|uniref:hypothetical protein n=1 Tax=Stenotrophobium rhamnosiphilum TaxID=2029166 RepID=UPI0011B225EF|nr:hypothetical protein [Stenotrophobium rhamnosiphilum]